MEYYDPIDRTSRRIATIATAIFMVVVVLGISLIRFSLEVAEREPSLDIIFEELIEEPVEEPEQPRQQSAPTDQRRDKAPAHVEKAKTESSNQTAGEAEKTETINPNALFKPVVGNSAEQVPEGNRLAPDGDKSRIGVRARATTSRVPTSLMLACRVVACVRDYPSQRQTTRRVVRWLCAWR